MYSLIVTYNPIQENLHLLVNALKKSGCTPIIIDNASKVLFSASCYIIRLEHNLGIAKAQNIGIEYAIKNNAKIVVFFDQDSLITDDQFIKKLYQPILDGKTKITAPVFTDSVRGFVYSIVDIDKNGVRKKYYPSPDAKPFTVSNVISSGTMVDVNALIDIGNMLDELFIDYVDTEWCLRAHHKGFNVLIIPSARMTHSIGDMTIRIGKLFLPKHSPFRRYYRVRNAFYLLRKKHIPKRMAFREIIFSIIHQVILIVYSKGERLAYISSLSNGIRDGVLGIFR